MRAFPLCVALLLVACDGGTLVAGEVPLKQPGATQSAPATEAPAPDPQSPNEGPAEQPPQNAPPAPDPLRLVVEAPARGTFHEGGPIQVHGRVTGGRQPTLTVAGQVVVPAADGAFSAAFDAPPGLVRVITEARDDTQQAEDRRAVIVGASAAADAPVEQALRVVLGPEGFDSLGHVVGAYISEMDLSTLVGQGGGDYELRELRHGGVEVVLTPAAEGLELRVVIKDLYVEIRAEVDVLLGDITVNASATAQTLAITSTLRLSATPDGGLDLQLSDGQADLRGFNYNIRNVPGVVERWFRGTVEDMAEDLLNDTLRSLVVPSLFDPASLTQTVDMMGTPLTLALRIRSADVDAAGLRMSLAVAAEVEGPSRQGPAFEWPVEPPTGGGAAELDLQVQANLINRILHAAWSGGVLDFDAADPEAGVDLPPTLGLGVLRRGLGAAAEGLPDDAELGISTRALLPPVARVEPSETPLIIEIGDLLLDLDASGTPLATVALDMTLRVGLEVVPGASLTFQPNLTAEVRADVAEEPRGPTEAALLENQIGTFASLLPQAVANETFQLGEDAFPVPVQLVDPRLEADPQAQWLHLRGGLSAAP